MHVYSPHPSPPPRRYCFVFVCQAGELEIKALLLAASLRRFLRCDYELVAAVPTPAALWGDLSAGTRELLQTLGVRIEPIVNPIDPDYKIGNKLACLGVATDADKIVFLDSDILCMRAFDDPACLAVAFAAKPADVRTFAASADVWRPLYVAAQTAMPQLRLPATVSGEFGLVYFNSGAIFVDAKLRFGEAWIECARDIQNEPSMRTQRHWLDQVSLAIAVHKLGLEYAGLDERYNFPAHLKPLPDEQPFFCHYHWPRILRRESVLLELVRDLAREHPAIAHSMANNKDWSGLLQAGPTREARAWRGLFQRKTPMPSDILIAGIPGSGGSDLLRALRQVDHVVTLDEPAELRSGLAENRSPWESATFLRDRHRDVLDGVAIESRLRDDEQEPAHSVDRNALPGQRIDAAGCALAVKSSLPFLCRLDALKRALPQVRFVACVHNPFDTIATWKERLPLPEMDATIASIVAAAGSWLVQGELDLLRQILAMSDPAEKRATWWWWLAQRLLNHAHGVIVVRYDDLIADPRSVLDTVLRNKRPGQSHGPVTKSASSLPGDLLDARERQAIRAICAQAAADLGVTERD